MREIEWSPGIGDPTFMGWFTVVAYLVVAWLCVRALQVEKRGPPRPFFATVGALLRVMRKHWPRPPLPARRAALWLVLAAIFLALGINKQLDLQTLVTEIGRVLAHRGGWYEERRFVQAIFVGVVALVGVIGLLVFAWLTRGQLRDFRVVLGGLAFLLSFVVIRAASFHSVDELIRFAPLGIRMNWVFELGGIALVGFGVVRRLRDAPERPTAG